MGSLESDGEGLEGTAHEKSIKRALRYHLGSSPQPGDLYASVHVEGRYKPDVDPERDFVSEGLGAFDAARENRVMEIKHRAVSIL